jgi:hypothetical protein
MKKEPFIMLLRWKRSQGWPVAPFTVYWFGALALGVVTITDASGIPQYVGLTGQ